MHTFALLRSHTHTLSLLCLDLQTIISWGTGYRPTEAWLTDWWENRSWATRNVSYSLIHTFILTHSPIHTLTHSLTHPLTHSLIHSLTHSAEALKLEKYSNLTSSHFFTPIAIESSGVFGPKTMSFIKDLGKRITRQSGDPRSTAFLLQRLSVAIQLGNAVSIAPGLLSPLLFDPIPYFTGPKTPDA